MPFTVAWLVSSLRQAGHSAAGVQLSGLVAADARDPQIMAGSVVLTIFNNGGYRVWSSAAWCAMPEA